MSPRPWHWLIYRPSVDKVIYDTHVHTVPKAASWPEEIVLPRLVLRLDRNETQIFIHEELEA